jgi:hypothetical protein
MGKSSPGVRLPRGLACSKVSLPPGEDSRTLEPVIGAGGGGVSLWEKAHSTTPATVMSL